MLQTTQALIPQVTIGAFTPTSTANTPLQQFRTALNHFNSCQRAVDLGLITAQDVLYTTAKTNLVNLWDPTFVDSL